MSHIRCDPTQSSLSLQHSPIRNFNGFILIVTYSVQLNINQIYLGVNKLRTSNYLSINHLNFQKKDHNLELFNRKMNYTDAINQESYSVMHQSPRRFAKKKRITKMN